MVEEVFNTNSNSQIYLNDHLTPYFTKLHVIARNAKKEGKLSSVSSHGGKIRVRKNANDVPITIAYLSQLQTLIDMENADSSIDSFQHADEMITSQPSTSNTHNTQGKNTNKSSNKKTTSRSNSSNNERTRSLKRRAETNEQQGEPSKKTKPK